MESVDHEDESEGGLVARIGPDGGSVGNGENTFDSYILLILSPGVLEWKQVATHSLPCQVAITKDSYY